jgi:hypothetical protein
VLVRGYQQAMQTAQVHVHPDLGFSETGPPTVKLPQVWGLVLACIALYVLVYRFLLVYHVRTP